MKHTLIALFSFFSIYVNAAPSVGYQAATNIANDCIAKYDETNLTARLNAKQGTLTAGANITIDANNVISATGGGGGADTNAVNDLIRTYDTTNLTARIAAKQDELPYLTNAIPATAIADAQWLTASATNGLRRMEDRKYNGNEWKATPDISPYRIEWYTDPIAEQYGWAIYDGFIKISEPLGDINSLSVEWPDYLWYGGYRVVATREFAQPANLLAAPTNVTGVITIDTNGIASAANVYTKQEVDAAVASASITNEGAKAYAEANFMKLETVPGFEDGKGYYSENFAMFYSPFSEGMTNYFIISTLSDPGLTWYFDSPFGFSECGIKLYGGDFTFEVSGDIEGTYTESKLVVDGSPIATSNMVERVIASKPAASLSGRTYDFDHGSNFTKRVYAALTNVIQALGGSVTNAPAF